MFNVGSQEIIILLFAVLMLFGSKRIPEVARSFGKGMKDFRKAMAGIEDELKLDLDLEDKPKPAAAAAKTFVPKLGAPEGTAAVGGAAIETTPGTEESDAATKDSPAATEDPPPATEEPAAFGPPNVRAARAEAAESSQSDKGPPSEVSPNNLPKTGV